MQVKTFIATVGLSAAAGAAAILMLPRNSKAYRTADNTVQAIKNETERMIDIVKDK